MTSAVSSGLRTHSSRTLVVAISAISVMLSGCFELGGSETTSAAPDPGGPPPPPPPTTNAPPIISGTPSTNLIVGRQWTFTPSASDPDGDMLTFSVENQPRWATFDTTNGTLSGVPQLGDEGEYPNVSIAVSDGQAMSGLSPFTLMVENVNQGNNQPPQISGTPAPSVVVGNEYSFLPSASDPDGDSLTFSIANRPAWASFNATNGRLRGTPDAGDVGVYRNVVISVSDGEMSAALPAATIEVIAPAPVNRAPAISGNAPGSVTVGEQYVFQPTASDPDGDTLTFSITNRPSWAAFNASTGMLSGTPDQNDAGTYTNIMISVSDGQLSASLAGFSITVNEAPSNDPPQISGSPATTATVGEQYLFLPAATDPDGDTLEFSIVNRPGWASFNTTNGRLRGTPGQGDVGIHGNIQISVSDGEFTDSLPAFAITVEEPPNSPPQISGTPGTSAVVGEAYSFTPTASDPDGDTLTFSIQNRPGWANFNTSNGRLSGTPQAGDAGNYSGIVISASDGQESDSLPAFSISVSDPPTGSVLLTWTPPDTNTDGSQLTDLKAYKFYWGLSPDNLNNEVRVDNPGISAYTIDNLVPNTYYFGATSINDGEVESDMSNIATKTVTAN